MKISNFFLNRKKNIFFLQKDLIYFISKFNSKNRYVEFLKFLEKVLNIEVSILKHETKIFLFSRFVNNKGKFESIFKLIYLPISVTYFILFFIYLKIFEKKKYKKEMTYNDILIDGIDRNITLEKYNNFKNKRKILFLVYDKKKYFNKYQNIFYFNYKNIFLEKKKRISVYKLCRLLIYSVYISLCLKDNIVPILIDFLKKYYKYNYIFFFNRSNFLIQERFYASSNIKDKIFHSYNGKLSCLLQKNLFQANGPGMFATSDVIFTLGKKSLPNLKRFDCKIKKIFAVGSLFMENSYFNHPNYQKKNKKIFNFDILVFASSHTSRFHSGYDTYYDEYYEHFNWIKKIALKYPNIKIGIKHKKDFNDKKEIQILKNIKNIFYIVDKSKFYSDSYLLAKNSKILVTWSSTLGYELISLNKNCYYLDPKNSNFAFLPPSKLNNKIRLTKFEEFENILKKMLQKKYIKKVKNKDDYCLSSKKTSEAIIKYLEKETTK